MTFSRRRIALAPIWITLAIALAIVLAVGLATPKPADAFIDEIVAALCNGGDPLEPPAQGPGGQAEVRALIATGFIAGSDFTTNAPNLTIFFDPTVPASKFRDAGVGDITIGGAGPGGVDLILSPGVEPDPDFPAHKHCANLSG